MLGITACAGSFVYFSMGYINPPFALTLVLGTFAGAYAGMNLLVHIKPMVIQFLFGVLMIAIAARMAMSL